MWWILAKSADMLLGWIGFTLVGYFFGVPGTEGYFVAGGIALLVIITACKSMVHKTRHINQLQVMLQHKSRELQVYYECIAPIT